MGLWFTTKLEIMHLDADEEPRFASPLRFRWKDGGVQNFYRLTPALLFWIRRMVEKAKTAAQAGSFPAERLLELERRRGDIVAWAHEHFSAAELAAAEASSEGLPIEPDMGIN